MFSTTGIYDCETFLPHTQIMVYFFKIKTVIKAASLSTAQVYSVQKPCWTTEAHTSGQCVLRGPISGVHNLKKKSLFAILTNIYCFGPKNKKQNNKQTKKSIWWAKENLSWKLCK